MLEYSPYHSLNFDAKSFEFGGGYVDFWRNLIAWAIKAKKKFIVRSKQIDEFLKKWDLTISPNVRLDYSSWRNVALTIDNLKGKSSVINQVCRILRR